MSLADAFAPAEALYRAQVHAATWGHLAPDARRKYKGYILFAFGEYGDIVPIKTLFKGLGDSPWFFEHMTDFIYKKRGERGKVLRFDGTYMMFKNGKGHFSGKIRTVIR